jgi:hypothetical protein
MNELLLSKLGNEYLDRTSVGLGPWLIKKKVGRGLALFGISEEKLTARNLQKEKYPLVICKKGNITCIRNSHTNNTIQIHGSLELLQVGRDSGHGP